MAEGSIRPESPTEYFRELLDAAMHHQRLAAREATSWYVVNLLASFVRVDRGNTGADDEPLGVRFVRALQEGGVRQRSALKQVGDQSLFVSGFFSDSLARSLVDIDYYMQLGECAYGSLAQQNDERLGEVFEELAVKFSAFVDVLGEVSERTAIASNSDLLRLYEKWLRTGSRRSGDLLASRGIVPDPKVSTRHIH